MTFRARAVVALVRTTTAVALGSLVAATPTTVWAQGFGLNEIGTCAIGRGFAVTASPCADASSLYWNPGALSAVPRGFAVYGGVTGVQVNGSYTRDVTTTRYASDVPVEYPPFLGLTWRGAARRGADRLALGVAAYVPYGLTSQWRDDFIGRFAAQKASLQTIYVQPTIAFDVVPGRFSVGAGAVVGRSTLELRQAIDFSAQQVPGQPAGFTFARLGFAQGTEFASAAIEGTSDIAYGAHVGAQLRLAPSLAVGARYLTKVRFEYDDAEATFTPSPRASSYVLPAGNPLGAPAGTTLTQVTASNFAAGGALAPGQRASTRIDHPAQLQVGVAFTGLAGTTIEADYTRVFWSAFDQLPVNFGASSPLTHTLLEEYRDNNSYRVGAEHRYASGVAARVGFSFAESPVPDQTVTPLLPDMDRYNFNIGAGIPLGRRVALDAGYLRVETRGRRGRYLERPVSLGAEQSIAQLNNGWYALDANVFSLGLRARF